MKLLITNDDGIDATGLKQLAGALTDIADIYVVAPHTQRSASGHGITLGRPVVVEKVDFQGAEQAFTLDGLPVDCVKMGLELLSEQGVKIDKVFSGINHGGNMGTDSIYSGTVAAAIEGSICGLPSVAVSINSLDPIQFETAKKLALRAAKLDFEKIDSKMVLNINVPNLPEDEIKGIKVTGLGPREYNEEYKKKYLDDGSLAYVYSGYPVHYEEFDCDSNDVGAFQSGYASISPLHFDLCNHKLIDDLKESDMALDL